MIRPRRKFYDGLIAHNYLDLEYVLYLPVSDRGSFCLTYDDLDKFGIISSYTKKDLFQFAFKNAKKKTWASVRFVVFLRVLKNFGTNLNFLLPLFA